jgi:hypothetical protein
MQMDIILQRSISNSDNSRLEEFSANIFFVLFHFFLIWFYANNYSSIYKKIIACYLIHADFFLRWVFDTEDGGDMFFRNASNFQRTTQSYIPEDRTLRNHRCVSPKSYTAIHNLHLQITQAAESS